MAITNPPPPFRVQALVDNPHALPHHNSISELWRSKWRPNCTLGIYPFVDGKLEDFEPIFAELRRLSNDSTDILYDPDAYAAPFLPVGADLAHQGEQAEKAGDHLAARDLFLRAAAVYRIARFPIIRSPLGRRAWEAGKAAYLRGGRHFAPALREAKIPFIHADMAAGDDPAAIPAYVRVPAGAPPHDGWPVVLFICGLDSYRTDNTDRMDRHLTAGCAVLMVEIPGTGDCPAARGDPASAERLWSSVLDWIADAGKEVFGFDQGKVVARGISTGSYYAFRLAHTHASRLVAAVGQGGWAHYALSPDWVRAMNHMEYPFALADAFACKLGYGSVEEMIADDAQSKFSLDENGRVLDGPSCRLLIINGLEDSIFPIEDSMLVASRGRVKGVRLMEGREHMGNPGAEEVIVDWISEVLAG